jgi:coiled-coil domain-containing protein 12
LQVAPAEAPSLQKVSPKVSLDANAERQDGEEAVLVHIAPNKANWDLRRDIAAKLVQLERRTQAGCIFLQCFNNTFLTGCCTDFWLL